MATEVDGNYTTTHLYLDEVDAESIPITIFFDPEMMGVESCEVFTNLNRRERVQLDANGDGIEDGIKPVDGNTIDGGKRQPLLQGPPDGTRQRRLSAHAARNQDRSLSTDRALASDARTHPVSYRYYTDPFGDLVLPRACAGGFSQSRRGTSSSTR